MGRWRLKKHKPTLSSQQFLIIAYSLINMKSIKRIFIIEKFIRRTNEVDLGKYSFGNIPFANSWFVDAHTW